jgi:hypothetical protein
MANGEGSKTVKIIVGIVLGIVVLGGLCCVGGYFLIPQEARDLMGEGMNMARQMAAGVQNYDKGFADDFGEDGRWMFGGAGNEGLLLVGVGADAELDEATVADLQDKAWVRYTNAFAEGGMPLSGVAIGRAGERTAGAGSYQGHVSDWAAHVVETEALIERTGVAAPPEIEFFESIQELEAESGGTIEVETEGNEIQAEPAPETQEE